MRLSPAGIAIVLLALCADAPGQGVTLPDYQLVTLENGATLIVYEKHDVPLVGVTAVLRGGAVTDDAGKAGLASLFAALLEKGAGEHDAASFAALVDGAGASLSAAADLESISISGEFLARDAGLAVQLLVDMLRAPRLDRAEFVKLRDRRIDLIAAAKDSDPRRLTPIYGAAWLFDGHPYGAPVDGDETTLARISLADVTRFYENQVGAERLVVAVVGDVAADGMIAALTAGFADWRQAGGPLPDIPAPARQAGRRVLLVDKPGATQTYFWIGNTGVSVSFPQRAQLDIANVLFGGRFTSLLNDELRTKAGLTYGASSALVRPSRPGSVAIVSYTRSDTTVDAIDLAIALLARMRDEGFSDELMASGKNYILGQFPTRLETSAQLADQLATLRAAGLDDAYINDYGAAIASASPESVRAVIDSVYPAPEDLALVIIGDAAQIRGSVSRYGPVTEVAITAPHYAP